MNLIRILKLAPYLPECQYETRYCPIYCTPVNWEQFFYYRSRMYRPKTHFNNNL